MAAGSVSASITTPRRSPSRLHRWWQHMGRPLYPDARRLLITPDGRRSHSSSRTRLWKRELQPVPKIMMDIVFWREVQVMSAVRHRASTAHAAAGRIRTGASRTRVMADSPFGEDGVRAGEGRLRTFGLDERTSSEGNGARRRRLRACRHRRMDWTSGTCDPVAPGEGAHVARLPPTDAAGFVSATVIGARTAVRCRSA